MDRCVISSSMNRRFCSVGQASYTVCNHEPHSHMEFQPCKSSQSISQAKKWIPSSSRRRQPGVTPFPNINVYDSDLSISQGNNVSWPIARKPERSVQTCHAASQRPVLNKRIGPSDHQFRDVALLKDSSTGYSPNRRLKS